MDAVRKDKKREADRIHFVLLEDIGRAVRRGHPAIRSLETAGAFPDIIANDAREGRA